MASSLKGSPTLNVTLNSIADIHSGYQFRGRVEPDPNGDVAVIQVKDLRDDAELQPDLLTRVALDKPLGPHQVSLGDVLFLSRGHRLFATALTVPLHRTIVPGYFYIVRPRTADVIPEYLAWYINQAPAQNRLKPSHAGTHMPIVPKSAFDQLEIELPSLNIQRAIVALDQLARRERQLSTQLETTRRQMIEAVGLRAISNDMKGSQQ